jgi:hypothetical protein
MCFSFSRLWVRCIGRNVISAGCLGHYAAWPGQSQASGHDGGGYEERLISLQ